MLTKIEEYRMRDTRNLPNLKDAIGQTDKPVAMIFTEYTDRNGVVHNVLAVKFEKIGTYRTEVKNFIESAINYWDTFENEPDEVKPAIKIFSRKSRQGNDVLCMELAE